MCTKNGNHPNPKSTLSDSRRRKRSPVNSQRDAPNSGRRSRPQSQSVVTKPPSNNLVMGQVKILKRGEPLISLTKNDDNGVVAEKRKPRKKIEGKGSDDLVLGSTDRIGPDPKTVQNQIRVQGFNRVVGEMYVGTVSSPPPSSLPVPSFLRSGGITTHTVSQRLLMT